MFSPFIAFFELIGNVGWLCSYSKIEKIYRPTILYIKEVKLLKIYISFLILVKQSTIKRAKRYHRNTKKEKKPLNQRLYICRSYLD